MTSPERWMQELVGAADEVAGAMNLGDVRVVGKVGLPNDMPGAYLPIVGGSGSAVYVGWLASAYGCERLAGALLGERGPGRLDPAAVADAMGEIVNIIAGAVKRRMLPQDDTLILGLPIYVASPILPLQGRALATHIRCGDVDGVLVLIGNTGSGERGQPPTAPPGRSHA